MKHLRDILTEARAHVELKIPYDLFENFMKDAIIDMEYDDSKYWSEMQEVVSKEYGEKTWRWFYGWCEGYMQVSDKLSIKDFYESMKKIPLDRFNRVIGAGSEGIVLDLHDDRVIKLCYGNEFDKSIKSFYQWCNSNKSSVFPRVYKLGKNWCVMEKLSMHTPKCKSYMSVIEDRNRKYNFIRDINNDVTPDLNSFTDIQKEVYHWCVQVKAEMDGIKYIDYPMDLGINNIGERKNGDIVFFDV